MSAKRKSERATSAFEQPKKDARSSMVLPIGKGMGTSRREFSERNCATLSESLAWMRGRATVTEPRFLSACRAAWVHPFQAL